MLMEGSIRDEQGFIQSLHRDDRILMGVESIGGLSLTLNLYGAQEASRTKVSRRRSWLRSEFGFEGFEILVAREQGDTHLSLPNAHRCVTP